VCVLDNLSGVNTPRKIGPMLKTADLVIVTKGDIVSQAEREVFAFRVRQVNAKARILFVNGITGQGAWEVSRLWKAAPEDAPLTGGRLRFSVPGRSVFVLPRRDKNRRRASAWHRAQNRNSGDRPSWLITI